MGPLAIGSLLLVVMFATLSVGAWIGFSLAITGWVGMAFFTNSSPGLNLATAVWQSVASWELAALPLFVWMGEILFRTNLANQMFIGLAPWLRRLPGRLLHVNVLACGIFGSVSGSSAATAVTIGKMTVPELKRRGYPDTLSLGSLAGSGTLGILIPPSIIMVVYAVAAEVSIIQIFLAGFLPGLLVMVLFSGYIVVWALLNPDKVPADDLGAMTFKEKLVASKELIPCMLLIAMVIWVIVAGYATATEAAAFGAVGSLALAWWGKSLTWEHFKESLLGATRLSAMIMFILAGAAYLTLAMGFTGIPRALAEFVAYLNPSKFQLIAVLTVMYIILGTALDGVSMIVLTTTIVLPMIQKVGIDPIWFGIFIVLLVEIAEVTPPVGFVLFVLQSMSGRDSWFVAYASLPFFLMLVTAIAIITIFPDIVTVLPRMFVEATQAGGPR
ncbi:TRAP transporter large permease [Phreatobacter sp. AB_2022a]|uniref:TRAP transporter large permease n=1 Tax=Phreatobacter sp. AB_2022a TaxID=3003134 RepID=UPI0022871635|nr:TRAP transporter large permease subunit [Phreatobacter sp. AB_2022a]MCZ0735194.1 TRAP transporter large permease subunit [Phreatobacter sp. AB_2022a]